MKLTTRLLITTLITALAVPVIGFAAKADRKKDKKDASGATFSMVDKDGDGVISQIEFVAAMKEKLGEPGAKSQFATLDKDSNGKLSKEEFETSLAPEKKKRRNKKNQN